MQKEGSYQTEPCHLELIGIIRDISSVPNRLSVLGCLHSEREQSKWLVHNETFWS